MTRRLRQAPEWVRNGWIVPPQVHTTVSGDKPLPTALERTETEAEPGVFGSALDLLRSGYDKLKSALSDSQATTKLEGSGALPKMELGAAKADTREKGGDAKNDQKADAGAERKVEVKANLPDNVLPPGKDKSDRLAEGAKESTDKAPTSAEFLKKHPELHLSKADRASVTREYDKALATFERDKSHLDNIREASDKFGKVMTDLKRDGITDLEDAAKFKEQFTKLPADKRAEYQKRFHEVQPFVADIARQSDLEAKVKLDDRRLRDVAVKLDFESELKALDKLPAGQRADVYKSLDKILDRQEKATGLTGKERLEISRDLVHNLAHPEDIKQGNKGTCALATTEYMLAREHPDVYAKSVAEWSTAGEVTSFGSGKVEAGKGAKIDPAEIHRNDGNPERGPASKVFQTGAANLAIAERGEKYVNYQPGTKEVPAVTQGKAPTPIDDTGERIITADGKVKDWPGLYAKQQVDVLNKLTGDNYVADKLYSETPDQLKAQLTDAADKHGYPIKVSFLDGTGGHVVSITGIDSSKSPAEVVYQDTAEPRGDPQRLPMNKFYERALKGGSVYAAGNMKVRIIATGPGAKPYVEIIHN